MNNNLHPACYGKLFPDTLHSVANQPQNGTVFSFTLLTAGGLYRSGRTTDVDAEQWEQCTNCPDFENCYKLSMAKLAMETAIAHA